MNTSRKWLPFYQADVFTSEPFGGNPLAVFPDTAELSDREFQQIAREMNLSETVFVLPPTDTRAVAKIRIFTPSQEIPFAGHPVLGTFYVLGMLKRLPLQEPVSKFFYECHIGVFPLEFIILKGHIERVVMSQPSPAFLEVVSQVEIIFGISKGIRRTQVAYHGFSLSCGGGLNWLAGLNCSDSNAYSSQVYEGQSSWYTRRL